MTLQLLWSVVLDSPARSLNGLALFFAVAGSWLLLATRIREQRLRSLGVALWSRPLACSAVTAPDAAKARINRFFYCFGGGCLAAALLLSWLSTQLGPWPGFAH